MSLRRIALALPVFVSSAFPFALAVCTFSSLTFPLPAVAQTSRGILAGVVRDPAGAVVPAAPIQLTNQDTGETRNAKTQNDGAYRVESLSPGRYTLSVTSSGFRTFEAKNILVNPSVVTSYDASLITGSATEVVEVTANSNTINTENGQLTGVISTYQLRTLPIFSLNPYELATTTPGVQPITQPGSGAGAQGQVFSVNGARPRANNFLIDGQEINDVAIAGQAYQPDIPGAYTSVAVIANNASAEYGRAGGAVSNLVTQAGTNVFHGSVFERYAGSGLNALSGTQRQQKPTATQPVKTRFDRHVYGFTAGGPIFKDKLFAFGAGEWNRYYGRALGGRFTLPNAAGVATLRGIQAQTGTVAATQAATFSNYLSNYSYLSQFALVTDNIEKLSLGTQPGCAAPCTVTDATFQRPAVPQGSTQTDWTVRVDWTPREKDQVAIRYIHGRGATNPDFGNNTSLVGFDSLQGGPTELGAGFWTHVFSPSLLNEFRASELRIRFLFDFTPETKANPLVLTPTLVFGGNGLPNLGPNQNFPQGRGEDYYQFQDTVSITRGRQSIRAGVDIGRQIETETVSQNALGQLTYAASGSFGSSLGEFLANTLGKSGTATKTFGQTRVDPHSYRSGVFAQDDIKVTPNLTANLGIRYDYFTNPENSLPFPGIDPLNPFMPINTLYRIKNDKNNIAPRIGFAYAPHAGFFADGKTVVRGGFGVFFDTDFSNIVVNAAQSSPNAVAATLTSTATDGLGNSNTLLGTITPVLNAQSSVTSVVNNLVNPYTYQYNVTVERQLFGNYKLAAGYVGTRGVKLFSNRMYNYFVPGTPNRISTARGAIAARGNFGTSEYNSLQAELSKTYSHGISFRVAYTYGKDLDNTSEIFTTFASPTSYQADLSPQGMRQEWGNSAWDHRNYVVASYTYAPTGLRSDNRFADAMLGVFTRKWLISGIQRFQSGPYTTFSTSGFDTNGDGSTTNDRAIVSNASAPFLTAAVDGAFIGGTAGRYYDLVAYNQTKVRNLIDPATTHFQIANGQQFLPQVIGRNSFLQPGTQNHDIALEKGFGLSYLHLDRGALTLRAEVQNIGNHNNVNPVGTNIQSIGAASQFNYTTARTGTGRMMYLWAKVVF